jgi:hypothetical protein
MLERLVPSRVLEVSRDARGTPPSYVRKPRSPSRIIRVRFALNAGRAISSSRRSNGLVATTSSSNVADVPFESTEMVQREDSSRSPDMLASSTRLTGSRTACFVANRSSYGSAERHVRVRRCRRPAPSRCGPGATQRVIDETLEHGKEVAGTRTQAPCAAELVEGSAHLTSLAQTRRSSMGSTTARSE